MDVLDLSLNPSLRVVQFSVVELNVLNVGILVVWDGNSLEDDGVLHSCNHLLA